MKLSLNIQKLNSVESVTTGLSKMVEDLRKLIETKDREIEVANSVIIEKGKEVYAARAEIKKAQNVMKNISALIEEKNE
jgi:peptidoglycan hydrolase CwlO-like protein